MSEQLTIDDHSTALFQSLIGLREKTKTVGNTRAYPFFRRKQADNIFTSSRIALLFSSRTA
jgi:hypothetical protein